MSASANIGGRHQTPSSRMTDRSIVLNPRNGTNQLHETKEGKKQKPELIHTSVGILRINSRVSFKWKYRVRIQWKSTRRAPHSVRNGSPHVDGSFGTVRIDALALRAWKRKCTGCGSRVSPMCIGKAMTGGPVRSTVAQGEGSSCLALTAVPEQRRRGTLGYVRFKRRADAAI